MLFDLYEVEMNYLKIKFLVGRVWIIFILFVVIGEEVNLLESGFIVIINEKFLEFFKSF